MADYVRLIHRQSGGTYGWRRIRAGLLDEYEMIVNRKLIKAIMVEHNIAGVPRASVFRNPLADKRVDTDLVNRIFTADGPNPINVDHGLTGTNRERPGPREASLLAG
ncbi:IS3 family transposase [Arthrobacter roseus]|uniref:IS3 family transposase n=1 Tax=Arthrobacter roseus TaxID=136274 RepID=UPI001964A269|nr:hypothetical protein [Arthrobacter roseus]